MERKDHRSKWVSWLAHVGVFAFLLLMHQPANAAVIELTARLYRSEIGFFPYAGNGEGIYFVPRKWSFTIVYDTDLAGPDLAPLDPAIAIYEGSFVVGARVRIEGQVPFQLSCGFVGGRWTSTPCGGGRMSFFDTSFGTLPGFGSDRLWPQVGMHDDDAFFELNSQFWGSYCDDNGRLCLDLDGDSINQLIQASPATDGLAFGDGSTMWFGDDRGNFESESGGALWVRSRYIRNVPEPGTLALLGLGLAGLVLSRRRLAP